MKSPETPAEPQRYKGNRKRTTVVLSVAMVAIGRKFFPLTKHGSVSAFLDAALEHELFRNQKRVRAAGIKLPESIFQK